MEQDQPSSEHIEDSSGHQYHIGLAPGEVAESIILVSDPTRAVLVAEMMDNVDTERRNREFVTFTGIYQGLPMSVIAIGMGAGNAEIAVIELCQCTNQPRLVKISMRLLLSSPIPREYARVALQVTVSVTE